MKSSIRKFLLINSLLAITMTTSLTAIGNYYLDQKDIQEHLDTLMAISALSSQALIAHDLHKRDLQSIQKELNHVPKTIHDFYAARPLEAQQAYQDLDKFNFQVWSPQGKLLLHSPNANNMPYLNQPPGFHDIEHDNKYWRVFSSVHPSTGYTIILAEQYDSRDALGRRIAQDDIYIMLLTFPLAGLLIWIIIGRGLDSLERVAEEVSNRAPSHLEPVNIKEVPQEIKPVIDELNHLFQRLEEGFDREKRFAADAAHELKTPLAALKTQAQVALNTRSNEEKDKALEKLIVTVNRCSHLVQQLLTINRLVTGTPGQDKPISTDLVKLTREVLALLAPEALSQTVDLAFEPEQESMLYTCYPTAISVLIRNLVDNAIRYHGDSPKILVKLFHKEHYLIIEVIDNGPGIAEALKKRVFERFFRVLGTNSTGSGLGLAIVQQIAELHDGDVTLDKPDQGHGLVVRVRLPDLQRST